MNTKYYARSDDIYKTCVGEGGLPRKYRITIREIRNRKAESREEKGKYLGKKRKRKRV
jgi:hypothetical protein